MIFFLLIIMVIFASFVVVLNQTTCLEQTMTLTRQMDNEVAREQVRVFPAVGTLELSKQAGKQY